MKIIAVYSNKGGVGKTATSVNLAHLMAKSGYRVLLCDLDPQGASSFYFRLKPAKKLNEDAFFTNDKKFEKSIKSSNYDNLDILPSNLDFKDFDIFLSNMKKNTKQLKKALKRAKGDYDAVVLDCPPTISLLSEAIFSCADAVIVPVIPTTLSERTLEQLYDFFDENGYKRNIIKPFFSMVQKAKKLHLETMERLKESNADIAETFIPFSTDVERMGIHREPLAVFAGHTTSAMHYTHLWREIDEWLMK